MAAAPDSPSTLAVEHDGAVGTAVRERHGWEVTLSAGTGRLDVPAATALLGALVDAIARHGGGVARWRVPNATAEHHRAAAAVAFDGSRRLVELRRPLPTPLPEPPLVTRPFVPGADDDEWLRVNNAAFAWHPEQSGWDRAALRRVLAEPWVDLDGFLLLPAAPDGRPGEALAGFCWTKVHDDATPPMGEIFVIAVDPAHHGGGIGRRLVLTGLAHMADRGITSAMLYTESDNARATALYDRLGFTRHHDVQVFTRDVPGRTGQTPLTPTSAPIP